jgi:hypothetical protein
MATRRKNTLPITPAVQVLLDALNAIRPAHWAASHGAGTASNTWMIYSEVFRAHVDQLKLNGEKTRGGYRVGIEVTEQDGRIETSYFMFDCEAAHKRFKANFRPEMIDRLRALGGGKIWCHSCTMRVGDTPRQGEWRHASSSYWIQRWLMDPRYYAEGTYQARLFELNVGAFEFDSVEELSEVAPKLVAAYLPLLECMFPLDGEPISPKRLTRIDPLRRNLSRVVGKPEEVGCECHKIAGFRSQSPCSGRLEAAHVRPYQNGGTGDADNGLWLCQVHHCETEGRIEGTRSLGVNLIEHVEQQRFSRLAICG